MRRTQSDDVTLQSELYHENSKLRHSDTTLFRWIGYVNDDDDIRKTISRPARHYRGYPSVRLPALEPYSSGSFEHAAFARRSVQEFSGQPIDLRALSKLLYFGGGITDQRSDGLGSTLHLRACPSGGALYPLELYCAAHHVDGLEPAIYYYDPLDHALRLVLGGDFREQIEHATSLGSVAQSAACIIICATFPRTTFKYGERGYRFALIESGHIAQNLLLAAEGEGLAATPVGGFVDDDLNSLIDLDGVNEAVLYLILVGGRSEPNPGRQSEQRTRSAAEPDADGADDV